MELFGDSEYVRWHFENGILKLEFKPDTVLDLTLAQNIDCWLSRLVDGNLYLILWDLSGLTGSDKAGRDYFSRHCLTFAKANAIYTVTTVSLAISRFVMRRCKASGLTQIFIDRAAALQHLRERQ